MSVKILNCVPNISEGRDTGVIEAVADAVRGAPGVRLAAVCPDADHNRTVYSFLGEPAAVLEAAKRLADAALERIDMSVHKGEHPRVGAVDVTPFIPVSGVSPEEALEICRAYGRWIGDEKAVPVYYYEDAAVSPARRNLADVRRGQYEGLAKKLLDPEWAPDEGPARFVPKSGACLVGVRFPLIAFNVNLRTDDVTVAKKIARAVRYSGGGFRCVRAIGVALKSAGSVQVSMNLTNYEMTPLPRVLEAVRTEAARYGVAVAGTEIVGAIPVRALEDVMRHYLQCHDFRAEQVLEMNCLPE
ncbi:MAG: glutamate formimidoyltransferase [Clostridiales bacterium]|jgi:glutamate formiminotransferase|nr:glutamate formimidoyltransferase [Clostridiales bacterium]